MSVTASTIKVKFPEFARLPDATITAWIDEAERNHNADYWAGKSDDGLSYMVAHFLAAFPSGDSSTEGLGAGPLTGDRQGQESASWSPMNIPKIFSKDDFGTTKYGRRYLSLRKSLFCPRCT